MSQYGDPEGTFSSVRTAAMPGEAQAYRTTPQFAVSSFKLIVMCICTFSLYELYWAYKQWEAVRTREGEELSPFWRAVFAPLWGFRLFPRMQGLAATHGAPATWSGTGLAVGYLVLHATWRLPDPWSLLSFLSLVPILIVQRSINELNAAVAPEAPRNAQLTGTNIFIMIIGGSLLFLSIVGMFLPPTP